MGKYLTLRLKNKDDKYIKKANKELEFAGFKVQYYNNIMYGAFITTEQLEEDARFMNEDPEGLKQEPMTKRPITVKYLENFSEIGAFEIKISSMSDEDIKNLSILYDWVIFDNGKDMIDFETSDDINILNEYLA